MTSRQFWRAVALAAVVVAVVFAVGYFAPKADAHPGERSRHPQVDRGFVARDRVPGRVVHIQLQGRRDLMGARRAIEAIDRRLPGIEVHSGDNASCKQRPRRYCVTIRRVHERSGYWGTAYNYWGRKTVIELNTYYGRDPWVAQHEFLHALGMKHHAQRGMMHSGGPNLLHPVSAAEWRALRAAY